MTRAENYVTLEFLSRSNNESFARTKGGVLEITVRDWGCGIPDVEEARRPLFTTGGSERSGMGFTIMESFMDKLTVRSLPGKGTTVQMRKRIAPRLVTR